LVLGEPLEAAPEGRDTHPGELIQLVGGELELAMLGQVLGQPDQVGLQAFGADVVHGFGDSPQHRIQLVAIGGTSLPAAGAPGQVLAHQPAQALAVEVGHFLHLVEHLAPLPAASLAVAGLK
jgi:hypothetical protein